MLFLFIGYPLSIYACCIATMYHWTQKAREVWMRESFGETRKIDLFLLYLSLRAIAERDSVDSKSCELEKALEDDFDFVDFEREMEMRIPPSIYTLRFRPPRERAVDSSCDYWTE